ncbi:MAG: solute:sodium symporter family transporter [Opitutaceae bacterium]
MFSLISFVFFTALVGLVSWLKTRKDDHAHGAGYFLAGNSLTGWVVAGSLMLTNLSTEQIVGLNGGAYLNGAMVMAWEVIAAIALVVMALYFLPRYWAGRITTVPQFIERRFGRGMRQILSVLFLFFITIQFLPFVLYSGALVINSLFDVPGWLGLSEETSVWVTVWAVGTIGSIYAVFGGLRAVAISDTVNGIGLLIGGFLVPVLGLAALGGGNPVDGWARILENQSGMLDPIGAAGSNIPVATLFTGMILTNVYYWCTNQQIVQRTFGAKSLAEGQKGVLIAAVLKLLGPLYLVLPGIIALEMFGSDLALPDTAYPLLVEAVLPAYLAGFFGAVLFGAILSSFNSALHSASTLFGLDVYKTVFRPQASDEETVRAGKVFGGVLAVVAMSLAPLIVHAPEGLFTLMKKVGAVINIPILAVVVMGVGTRRTHARAARIGLFSGMLFYVVFSWVLGNRIGGFEIHWLHSVGLNFVFMCGLMALLSRLIPAGETSDEGVLRPAVSGWWRLAKPMSAALIVLVFALYVLLHQLGN